MRAILVTVLVAELAACAASPMHTTEASGFTASMASKLGVAGLPAPVETVSPLTLRTHTTAGTEVTLNLDRIYGVCGANPSVCDTATSQYVDGVAEMLNTKATVPEQVQLRVVVRPADYLTQHPSYATISTPFTPPTMPKELIALVDADQPRTIRSIGARDLQGMHLTAAQAYDVGLRNTAAELRPQVALSRPPAVGSVGKLPDDPYASSRLLLHSDWSTLSDLLHGHLIVAAPSAELVIYADGGTPDRVAALSLVAHAEFDRAQRAISPAVFEWRPDRWVTVAP